MIRAAVLALALSLLIGAAPATAERTEGRRAAAVALLVEAAGLRTADARSECRLRCERLRANCTGSQCRAAYAACISGCRER
ncbi:MAG TPA: hypothetical protein VMV26_12105 [Alphaproteobacteria bacterium]|jgi:hypothetical protein|nr:hypothetical protein [Alphaproteobacteria bacterium]